MILIIITYILTLLDIFFVESSHFSGGTVTWKPIANTITGSTVSVMFTQSYQWRLSTAGYCNQTYIVNRSPLIPSMSGILACVSSHTGFCGGYSSMSIFEYCTDYSTFLDSSSGQISTVQTITIGSQFCVAFQSGSWIPVQVACASSTGSCYNGGASWSIGTCLDLNIRYDGVINTPPVATVVSPINVPVNSVVNIDIPVTDANNDVIRCRWAQLTTSLDECAGVCGVAAGSTLNSNDCKLTFNSTGKTVGDYYVVALMVEDYWTSSSYLPFSSIPLQFLIKIVSKPSCFTKPKINSSLQECTAITVGVTFTFTLTIMQGCVNTTIGDIYRIPPLNMYKSEISPADSINAWIMNETWIPTVDQVGSQVYCAIATDSNYIQSEQYCLTFTVVSIGQPLTCPTNSISNRTTVTTTTSTYEAMQSI
ncbi:unnamed protein product [Rotaria sp. Silwood1]|nr:unnamed protein product [Rotaria sp. Silwood1]CAF1687593.1 unnamed protein product [Rotaria sp. Silwood1]